MKYYKHKYNKISSEMSFPILGIMNSLFFYLVLHANKGFQPNLEGMPPITLLFRSQMYIIAQHFHLSKYNMGQF